MTEELVKEEKYLPGIYFAASVRKLPRVCEHVALRLGAEWQVAPPIRTRAEYGVGALLWTTVPDAERAWAPWCAAPPTQGAAAAADADAVAPLPVAVRCSPIAVRTLADAVRALHSDELVALVSDNVAPVSAHPPLPRAAALACIAAQLAAAAPDARVRIVAADGRRANLELADELQLLGCVAFACCVRAALETKLKCADVRTSCSVQPDPVAATHGVSFVRAELLGNRATDDDGNVLYRFGIFPISMFFVRAPSIAQRVASRGVSSAALKLREALARAGIDADCKAWSSWTALDIGAAPGSWTAVLADYVGKVVACDPANLHADVLALPNVVHVKKMLERGVEEIKTLVCLVFFTLAALFFSYMLYSRTRDLSIL